MHIPPLIDGIHLAEYLVIAQVREAQQVKIEVQLKWEMCQNKLETFEHIPIVLCSEDMQMFSNAITSAERKIKF